MKLNHNYIGVFHYTILLGLYSYMRQYYLAKTFILSAISFTAMATEVEFNGFLSAGAGQIIDHDDFNDYAGYDQHFNTSPDTTLGFQVRAEINEKISAASQLLAEGKDSFDVEAEWAYLSYQAIPYWTIRAGQLKTAYFMFSDILDVGYAYPWIRPPSQTYNPIRLPTFQGLDTVYNHAIGHWDGLLQVYYGRLKDSIMSSQGTVDTDIDTMAGIAWSMTYNYKLTLRAVYHTSHVTTTLPNDETATFVAALRANNYGAIADALVLERDHIQYFGLGAHYEDQSWVFISEYTLFDVKEQSYLSDENSFYATLGYRHGNILYHFTYDYRKGTPDYTIANALKNIPSTQSPEYDLSVNTFTYLGSEFHNSDYTLGLRYDFAKNTALKVELTQFNHTRKANPYLATNAGEPQNLSGVLISTAIDLVF